MVLQNPPDNPSVVRHDRFANPNIRLIESRRRKLQNAEQIAKTHSIKNLLHPPLLPPPTPPPPPVHTTTPAKPRTRSLPTQKPTASGPDATPYKPVPAPSKTASPRHLESDLERYLASDRPNLYYYIPGSGLRPA